MAEIVIKVETDTTGHVTGDIVDVFTDDQIAAVWAQIPLDDPDWLGADRTRMPFSEDVLAHFLIVRVVNSPIDLRLLKRRHRDDATHEEIHRRRYWINWQDNLGLANNVKNQISNRNIVVDLRNAVVDLTSLIEDRAA